MQLVLEAAEIRCKDLQMLWNWEGKNHIDVLWKVIKVQIKDGYNHGNTCRTLSLFCTRVELLKT